MPLDLLSQGADLQGYIMKMFLLHDVGILRMSFINSQVIVAMTSSEKKKKID